jgi:hypothetical protein
VGSVRWSFAMSFEYQQSTGEFTRNGVLLAMGYSGNGAGMNNPAMQDQVNLGPIPQGVYTIEPAHDDDVVGPVAMNLVPDAGNQMFCRGGFLIHGDNATEEHSASEGCIILDRYARVEIGADVQDGDNQLTVVA